MTDFDKLIREKAEQAEYSYKPSAWRQFMKKTGISGSKTHYWTIGLSSALVVSGVVAFFSYYYNTTQPNAEPSLSVPSADTTSCQVTTAEAENLTTETYQVSEKDKSMPNNERVQGKQRTESVVDSATQSAPKIKTTHVENTPRYGRPLVIDVDTIKENVPTDEELRNGNSRLY